MKSYEFSLAFWKKMMDDAPTPALRAAYKEKYKTEVYAGMIGSLMKDELKNKEGFESNPYLMETNPFRLFWKSFGVF